MPYKAKTKMTTSVPTGIALGLAINWVITIGLTALSATLILSDRGGEGLLALMAVGTLLVATFCGTLVASRKTGSRRMLVCLISGGVYFISLAGVNALLFEGRYQGFLPALLTIIGCSLLTGLVGLERKSRKMKGFRHRY